MATMENWRNPQAIIFSLFFLISFLSAGIGAQGLIISVDNFDEANITLCWTAPGDDGHVGRATDYEIRYTTIVPGGDLELWWNSATAFLDQPVPENSGIEQCYSVSGLDQEQVFYFAIKACDEAGNWSQLSNIASSDYIYYSCADVNGDGRFNIVDILDLIDSEYSDGDPPVPGSGDVNSDGMINLLDLVYLVDYRFKSGPEPHCSE
jgi:hypothetical protein